MSGSVNRVILVGRLGKDATIRYTQDGTPVANFSLATDETFTDRAGDKQTRTEWHRIVAWKRLAEVCGEYLTKGKLVYIEGSIHSNKYEDREGNPRTSYNIVARQMQMLSNGNGNGAKPKSQSTKPTPEASEEDNPFKDDAKSKEATDEDIPW